MAVKTFTSEVLTSADTNTYLANSGLVYVKSQTVGAGVSSVEVTDAFSSTYDSYQIVYTGGASSGTNNLGIRLGSTTTGYYGTILYSVPSTPAPTGLGVNNGANWTYVGDGTLAGGARLACNIYAPNLAVRTGINAFYVGTGTTSGAFGTFNGNLDNATQYTAFTIIPNSGTLTGGTITVYGYRKA